MTGGREKVNVYMYDKDGSYIRSFNSITEFSHTFNLEKNISHRYKRVYNDVIYIFDDLRIACLRKIGRTGVREFFRWYNSSINKEKGRAKYDYYYEMYDMYGEKVAEFPSAFHLHKITGIDVRNRFTHHKENKTQIVKLRNGIDIKRVKYLELRKQLNSK